MTPSINSIVSAVTNAVTSAAEAMAGTPGEGLTNATMTMVANTTDTIASAATSAAGVVQNVAVAAGGTEPGHGVTTTTTTLGAASTSTEGAATGGAGAADNGLSSGAIAGIAIGVLVAVGVVCTAIGCYCRRTCHRGSTQEDGIPTVSAGVPEGHHAPDVEMGSMGRPNDAFGFDEEGDSGSNGPQPQVRFEPPQGGGNAADSDS